MRNKPCISALKTWLSSAFLLLSLFFAQGASAADDYYYWKVTEGVNTTYIGPGQGSDPKTACDNGIALDEWRNAALGQITSISGDRAICKLTNKNNGATLINAVVYRFGTGCPAGQSYNATTAKCEGDPCLSTSGQKIKHEFDKGPIGGSTSPEPPSTVCQNSCQYAFTYKVLNCYRYVEATDGKGMDNAYCSYEYSGNGMSCTSNAPPVGSVFDQPATKPPSSPEQEYLKKNDCDNWVTNADGTRTRSCLSQDFYKNPGNMNCTATGGSLSCTAGSPPPYLKDKQTETTTTETTNADGSKGTSTSSTTSTTICKGASPCETTTKNEGKETTTNPDGTEGDSSETCTGDDCNPEEEGEEEQEEEEQCDPATDPNKCGQSSVTGEACDTSVNCSGDAIQCAILRKQKEQTCADEEFREVTPEKVTELKNTLNGEFSGEEYQPLTTDSSNTFDFASALDTSSRFSKSCPVMPDLSVAWIDGSTAKVPFSEIIDDLCAFLQWMGYLLVAFAMRGAAEIIANGMK